MTRFRLPSIITMELLSVGIAIADDAQAYRCTVSKRDAAACYNVMDADKRTLYIAKIKAERSLCYSVVHPSFRNECMARAKTTK